MSGLRELLAVFSIEVEDSALKEAEKKIHGFGETLKVLGETMAETFALDGIKEFFESQIEMAARTQDLSDKLGVGTTELQHFQFAAKSVGVDGESAAHSLGFLNKNIGEAIMGSKESAEAFAKLHIGLKDTAGNARPVGDVLMNVSDALEGLGSQQERAAVAVKLFGREGQTLLPILSQGSEKIREMYGEADELGIILGGDFFRDSKKAREEMEHFGMVIQALKARITAAALPAITALFKWFQKISKPIQDVLTHTHALQHAMEILAGAGAVKLILTVGKLAKVFGLLQPSVLGTVKALMGFAAPVLAIGALYLLFDDLFTLMEGGDSVIGDVLTKLGGVEGENKFVDDLKQSWDDLMASWVDLKPMADDLLTGLVAAIPAAVEGFIVLLKVVKGTFDSIVLLTDTIASSIMAIGSGDWANVGKAIDEGGAKVMKDLDFSMFLNHPAAKTVPQDDEQVSAPVVRRPGAPGAPGASGRDGHVREPQMITYGAPTVPSPVAGAAGNTVTQTNSINVTVQGGKDAKDTADTIAAKIQDGIATANYNALLAQARR